MKIRKGLVSNSSSSSYVIVVEKETFYKTLEKLHPYEQEVANALAWSCTVFGTEAIAMSCFSDGGCDCDSFDDLEIEYSPDYGGNARSAFFNIQKEMTKNEGTYWECEEEW